MRSDQGSRSHQHRYFVLQAPDQILEVARINGHGAAAFFEPATGTWINDPLLGVEIHVNADWRPAAAHEVPPGVELPAQQQEPSGRGRRRKSRRGRHANPAA